MRHAWARAAAPRTKSCRQCGSLERQRIDSTGAWQTEYAKKQGGRWSKVKPKCRSSSAAAPPTPEPRCDIVVQERPYLLCAEDVARLLALPGRDAVLAEVESGRLEKPVAGERWLQSDLLTYASALQALRDQGDVDADRR